MTKRTDLGLKTLFCTNTCTLRKFAKKCCAQWENDKRADLRLKTLFWTTLFWTAPRLAGGLP